jgi:heptosyltransferase III
MKILIVKRDKLGDMLLTTPAIRILRNHFPHAQIHLLANVYNAWVVANNKDIDRIWVYERIRTGGRVAWGAIISQAKLYYQLRQMKFDVAIAAGGDESPRAIKRTLGAGAKRSIAYADSAVWRERLTDALTPIKLGHECNRIANQLVALRVTPPVKLPMPTYSLPAHSLKFANDFMGTKGLLANRFILVGTGARFADKQPTAKQILQWAQYVHARYQMKTVLVWTPGAVDSAMYRGDDDIVKPILTLTTMPEYLVPLTTATQNIQDVIAVIEKAALSIFPDSGLMHFAACTQGDVIGLFASEWSEPEQWAPVGSRSIALVDEQPLSQWPDAKIFSAIDSRLASTVI